MSSSILVCLRRICLFKMMINLSNITLLVWNFQVFFLFALIVLLMVAAICRINILCLLLLSVILIVIILVVISNLMTHVYKQNRNKV